MSLLTVTNIEKFFGAEQILDGVSFRIERGDHVALVGANGAGKSTLLRIVAGLEEPDAGTVSQARNTRVVYLPQEPEFDLARTLYETMLEVFRATTEAQERLRAIEDEMERRGGHDDLMEEYGRLQVLVEHAGYDYREQIERVLTGLELQPSTWHIPLANLSGGQRTRANLARTLLQDADLLLLDEPTNHLDIRAVEWLETYLCDLKRAFVIVAHDRYLLDRVTRRTLELSGKRITAYDAAYSRYLQLRTERMERRREEFEAQQEEIARTEEFIRRYGAGQRAKEARGRQKKLDRVERIERPQDEDNVHLQLRRPERSGDIVLLVEKLVAGYPNNPLLRLPREVTVRRGQRIAVMGPNGSGKTTLLRTLIGAQPPLEGRVRWGSNTSVGYYSQTLGQLNERLTVLEEIQRTRPMAEEEARGYLGRFLFSGDDAFKTVGVLSGGEKSRVALAKLILEESNVLVLDEPTNHLDLASQDALQRVLSGFEGTLLFVSHDRYLVDALAEELWVVEDGLLRRYDAGYTRYASGNATPLDVVEHRARREAPERNHSPEERIRRLEEEAVSVATRLAETSVTAPLAQLIELSERYAEIQTEVQEAEQRWLNSIHDQIHASLG